MFEYNGWVGYKIKFLKSSGMKRKGWGNKDFKRVGAGKELVVLKMATVTAFQTMFFLSVLIFSFYLLIE